MSAAIAAVMIGHRDKIHRPSALLLRQSRKIFRGTKKSCGSGSVIDGPIKVAVDVGDHDDVLVRHSRKFADDDIFLQIRIVLDVPAQARLVLVPSAIAVSPSTA